LGVGGCLQSLFPFFSVFDLLLRFPRQVVHVYSCEVFLCRPRIRIAHAADTIFLDNLPRPLHHRCFEFTPLPFLSSYPRCVSPRFPLLLSSLRYPLAASPPESWTVPDPFPSHVFPPPWPPPVRVPPSFLKLPRLPACFSGVLFRETSPGRPVLPPGAESA